MKRLLPLALVLASCASENWGGPGAAPAATPAAPATTISPNWTPPPDSSQSPLAPSSDAAAPRPPISFPDAGARPQ